MDAPRFMALDAITYLPGDLMTKVDRASMAVSLEMRAPYLDRDVVELAWRIPQNMKIRGGQTKWILRQILGKYLPQSMIDRPKMGFGMPIAEWLRGPLRDLVETYLSRERLSDHGLFDVEVARQIWARHKSGQEDNANAIWSLLMLQLWIEALRYRRLTALQLPIKGVR
jgi:asparagine synthase (glutamine-hydrolysing)